MVLGISTRLYKLILKIWVKEVSGLENLPKERGFICAANHGSYLDDIIMPVFVIRHLHKFVHVYCNDSYMRKGLLKKWLEHGEVIPIRVYKSKEQKEINEKAFQAALGYLKKGEIVGIFPEGHRTSDGNLQKGHLGVSRLAIESKAPIVPIGIIGSYDVWPKGKKFPGLGRCKVKIGKPLYFKTDDKEHIARTVMKDIAKLTGQEYNH
ncbi:MAG: 1-acyl-sn-glycerol-3-phosphate acyltransferase [Nanoarchaeota archaeon]|nr:1-acyl-sn-glycerol-3-phosphate acyltransferase [Nanoarchaeota archaeon]